MAGPEAHHELGASGAYRWLVCPGSVPAQRGIEEQESVFAAEGTSAHELAELSLLFWKNRSGSRDIMDWRKRAEAAGFNANEMVREVEKYTEYVRDLCGGDATLLEVEQRVDLHAYINGGFGTADAVVVTPDELGETVQRVDVGDLKYGKGKTVYAEKNPQLSLYALGVLKKLITDQEIDLEIDDPNDIIVGLHICQPRLDHFDDWETTLADLLAWGEAVVRPAVKRIDDGDATRVPGTGCDFCKAAATCKPMAEKIASDLDCDFDEFVEDGPGQPSPDDLTPEQIGKLLVHKSAVEKWFGKLKDFAHTEIEAGRDVPGWKLVEGNRRKEWAEDADDVLEKFKNQRALKQDEYAPRKLITPAQADKLLPEKSGIRDLIVETRNAPRLVEAKHKAPALVFKPLDDDFDDEEDEEI